MTTLEIRLMDEVKERILNEVERERRKKLVLRMYEEGLRTTGYDTARGLGALAEVLPDEFVRLMKECMYSYDERIALGAAHNLEKLAEVAPDDFVEVLDLLKQPRRDKDHVQPVTDGGKKLAQVMAKSFAALPKISVELYKQWFNWGMCGGGMPHINFPGLFNETVETLSALADVDPVAFVELFERTLSYSGTSPMVRFERPYATLARVDPERFAENYRKYFSDDSADAQQFLRGLVVLADMQPEVAKSLAEFTLERCDRDLALAASVRDPPQPDIIPNPSIIQETIAGVLRVLAKIDRKRFTQVYKKYVGKAREYLMDREVFSRQLGVLASLDRETFLELYDFTLKKCDPRISEESELVATLAETAPDRFIELYKDRVFQPGFTGGFRKLAQQRPKEFLAIVHEVFTDPTSFRIFSGAERIVTPLLEEVAHINAETYLNYYGQLMRHHNSQVVYHTAQSISAIADANFSAYREWCEKGMDSENENVRKGTAQALRPLASRDPELFLRLKEKIGQENVSSREDLTAYAIHKSRLNVAFAATIKEKFLQPIWDFEYIFLDFMLGSKYVCDEEGTLKTEDQLIVELKTLIQTRHDYEIMIDILTHGKARNIDEIVECSRIGVIGYTGLTKLGSGGSGDCYLAIKDNSRVPRKIKIFRSENLDHRIKAQRSRRDLSEIVRNESDVLAEISHPNVARYFDHGVASDRRPYTVSEYVEGVTVEEALPTLTFVERAYIFYRLAEVMAFFHGLGYVIRDFKLNNVIWNPEKKLVKVTDLETIRRIEDEREEGHSTRGSDRYAAPELTRGERATTKSDLYGLGACFLYLHQGRAGGLEEINILNDENYRVALRRIIDNLPSLQPQLDASSSEPTKELEQMFKEERSSEDIFEMPKKDLRCFSLFLSREHVLYSLLKYNPQDRFVTWLRHFGIYGWKEPHYPRESSLILMADVVHPENLNPF